MPQSSNVLNNSKTGQRIKLIRRGKDTGGQRLEMEATFRPRSQEPTPHYHPQQAEDFKVIAGELTVRLNGQRRVFKAGDTLHVPANTVHSMWNDADQEAVVNWVVQPALDTEQFFRITTGLANDGKTNEAGMPSLLQVALLVNRFSGEFRLAKPSFVVQKLLFTLLTPVAYLAGFRPTYPKYLTDGTVAT